jgi:flagellar hook protein FlgE
MLDALQIGLSGMRAQEVAVSARARNIVNVNTKGYLPVEPVFRSSEGGVQATIREQTISPEVQGALAEMPAGPVDLATELVNLRLAEIAYKASSIVVRTAGRMQDEALETFA